MKHIPVIHKDSNFSVPVSIDVRVNTLYEYYPEDEMKDWRFFVRFNEYDAQEAYRWLKMNTYQDALRGIKPSVYDMMRRYQIDRNT